MRQTTHKLISTAAAVCLVFGTTTSVFAQGDFAGSLNTVSISDAAGTNKPPTASFTYTQDGDTFTFDAGGSFDSDGSIIRYIWDLGGDVVSEGISTTHTYPINSKYNVTLTVVDDKNGITLAQIPIDTTPQPSFQIAVNFQPYNVPIPSGFDLDSGTSFDSSKGYGWVKGPASQGTRDRDSANSADQAHDTMIHVAPTSVWEIALPNGNYTVTICDGDAIYSQGTQNVQAEGVSIINNQPLSVASRWVEGTSDVSLTDGKLTITFNGSTDPARLAWLKIASNN